MASAQGVRAGRAFVELGANDDGFQKALKATSKRLEHFGKELMHLGGVEFFAFGLAKISPVIMGVHNLMAEAMNLTRVSRTLGVGAEELSRWQYVAEQTGVSLDDVASGLARMRDTTLQFAQNNFEAMQAVRAVGRAVRGLGYSFSEWQAMGPDQQLEQVAEAMHNIPDANVRLDLAQRLGVTNLLPMLVEGAEGLRRFRGEADALGVTMAGRDVAAGQALRSAWVALTGQFNRLLTTLGAAVAGPLAGLSHWFKSVLGSTITWINANRHLVAEMVGHAAVFISAGVGIAALGLTLTLLGSTVAYVASMFAALGAVVGFVLSPIGLVTAAVAGGLYAFTTYTAAGRTMAQTLSGSFASLRQDATDAFGGIGEALASGNISAAAEVLWALLKLEWARGTAWLMQTWDDYRSAFATTFGDMWYGAQRIFASVTTWIASTWDSAMTGILNFGTEVATTIGTVWTNVVWAIRSAWNTAFGFLMSTLRQYGMYALGVFRFLARALPVGQRALTSSIDDMRAHLETAEAAAGPQQQAQQEAITAEATAENERRRREADERVAARRRELAERQAELDQRLAQAQAGISEEQATFNGMNAGGDLSELERQVAEARAALRDATAAARRPPTGASSAASAGSQGGSDNLRQRLAGLGLNQQHQSVVGSFNAFAAAGLGAGGPEERTARNTATANGLLRSIHDAIQAQQQTNLTYG